MSKPYVRKRPERFSKEWLWRHAERDPQTDCILWTGFVCKYGYVRTWQNGKSGVLLHRIAYESAFGPFDPSLKVCHRCDTPRCFNPEHLFLGTQKDNLRDMFAKGRARPQGKIPKNAPALAPTVTPTYLENTVKETGIIHLTGTSVMPARWCQVLGQPGASDASEIPAAKRPRWWTVELPQKSSTVSDSRDTGSMVSGAAS